MKTTNSRACIFLLSITLAIGSAGVAYSQQTSTPAVPPLCDCKGWSGEPIKFSSPIVSKMGKCDGSVKIKKGSYALTSPKYFCTPSTCLPSYFWNITGPVIGTHTGKTYGFTFSVAGTYIVTITPICGTHKCKPCKFTVVATL